MGVSLAVCVPSVRSARASQRIFGAVPLASPRPADLPHMPAQRARAAAVGRGHGGATHLGATGTEAQFSPSKSNASWSLRRPLLTPPLMLGGSIAALRGVKSVLRHMTGGPRLRFVLLMLTGQARPLRHKASQPRAGHAAGLARCQSARVHPQTSAGACGQAPGRVRANVAMSPRAGGRSASWTRT